MEEPTEKKENPNFFYYHEALLGTLSAIHSLESSFPAADSFWNGQRFLQYQGALRALTALGKVLYEDLAKATRT